MQDYLYTGRIDGLQVGFSLCLATGVAQDAVLRHDCDPVSAHLLSRAVAAGLLAAAPLGPHQRLNIHWKYTGNLRTLVVDAGPDATVRGLVSPTDLAAYGGDRDALYGEGGQLHVTRSRDGRILASSTTPCRLLEAVDDLGYFLSTSDQVETALAVLVGFNRDAANPVDLCQGVMVQALPGCDLAGFEGIRARLRSPGVRALLGRKSEADNAFEQLVRALVGVEGACPPLHLADRGRPRFACTCGPGKMGAVLRAIPAGERADILARGEDLVVHCEFCRARYVLGVEACRAAWGGGGGA